MIKVDSKTHTSVVSGDMGTIFCESIQLLRSCMAAAKQVYHSDEAAEAFVNCICKAAKDNKIPEKAENLHIYEYKGNNDDFEEFLRKKYGV